MKHRVTGFYKSNGKTRPITKSLSRINQKKIIKNPRFFRAVMPHSSRRADVKSSMQNYLEVLCKRFNLPLGGSSNKGLQLDFAVPPEMRKKQGIIIGMSGFDDYPIIYCDYPTVKKMSASERETALQHEINHLRDFLRTGKKITWSNFGKFINPEDYMTKVNSEVSAWQQVDSQLLKQNRKQVLTALETYLPRSKEVLVRITKPFIPKASFMTKKNREIEVKPQKVAKGEYYILGKNNRLLGMYEGDNDHEYYPGTAFFEKVTLPTLAEQQRRTH